MTHSKEMQTSQQHLQLPHSGIILKEPLVTAFSRQYHTFVRGFACRDVTMIQNQSPLQNNLHRRPRQGRALALKFLSHRQQQATAAGYCRRFAGRYLQPVLMALSSSIYKRVTINLINAMVLNTTPFFTLMILSNFMRRGK